MDRYTLCSKYCQDRDDAAYSTAAGEYQRWGNRYQTGQIIAGVGVALTVVGVAVKVENARITPDLRPDGGGVRLTIRR